MKNAAGGRVVTAPTNGAAGIIPAVLKYYLHHCSGTDQNRIIFLNVATIGILYKTDASISGASRMSRRAGSACSIRRGRLLVLGELEQVENAAEIAMEHNQV